MKEVFDAYDSQLNWNLLERPVKNKDTVYNYAYYPVVFSSEQVLKDVLEALREQEIIPRRYFYPSLNTLPFMPRQIACPVSENISERVLCLPLYVGLPLTDVERISAIINSVIAP